MDTMYSRKVIERSLLRYYLGLMVRRIRYFMYSRAVSKAISRGATIGEGVVMPFSLAKKANSNLIIGNHVSIQTDKIDMRSPVQIGNHVIIGSGVEIITASHNIDSPEWDLKTYGITIGDFAWIATNATLLPSCRSIGFGSVVGEAVREP